MQRHASFAAALLVPALAACDMLEPAEPPPQEMIVRVESDPGRPVRGAVLKFQGKTVNETGEDGLGKLRLRGKDGEAFDFQLECPEGYQSPSRPIQVVLKRLADPDKRPEYLARCAPTTRSVVVAVRADNGANLPLLHLGREVARTDAAGAAHVLLKMKPDDSFELTLGTEDNERLRPQNPSASFVVRDHDDLLTFDQKFELERVVRGRGRRPTGPVKIGK